MRLISDCFLTKKMNIRSMRESILFTMGVQKIFKKTKVCLLVISSRVRNTLGMISYLVIYPLFRNGLCTVLKCYQSLFFDYGCSPNNPTNFITQCTFNLGATCHSYWIIYTSISLLGLPKGQKR
jgi:hypothetical protein